MKKVPGTLHFLAKSPGHSFDFAAMNLSHIVHHYYFGAKPALGKAQAAGGGGSSRRVLTGRCRLLVQATSHRPGADKRWGSCTRAASPTTGPTSSPSRRS